MPDFSIAIASGAAVCEWADPAYGVLQSRLNPRPGIPHLRYVGTVGVQVELHATVGGVVTPMDATLGGRLFAAWTCERPTYPYPVSFSNPTGQTAIQRFTPDAAGHYVVGVVRPEGGAVLIHLDVEDP